MKEINIANFFASALSEKYLPAVIVVDAEFNLRHVTDPAKKYLTVPNDPSIPKLTRMIPAKLAVALQVALIKVRNEALSHSLKGIKAKIGMQLMTFDITIEPFTVPKEIHNDQLFSIILHEGNTEEWETDGYENETFNSLNEINLTLKQEVDDLSRVSQEKEQKQESEIERLKSLLEESEKNNQTFQSIHEDLQKLNSDYRFSISELTKSKSYLEHQIESLTIPFLFLDEEINIHKFSSGVFKLINIRQADIGRPIKHYTTTFKHFSIHNLAEDVLASGASIEDFVVTNTEEKYLVKGLPFHTTDNEHQGVVVIFYFIPQSIIEKLIPAVSTGQPLNTENEVEEIQAPPVEEQAIGVNVAEEDVAEESAPFAEPPLEAELPLPSSEIVEKLSQGQLVQEPVHTVSEDMLEEIVEAPEDPPAQEEPATQAPTFPSSPNPLLGFQESEPEENLMEEVSMDPLIEETEVIEDKAPLMVEEGIEATEEEASSPQEIDQFPTFEEPGLEEEVQEIVAEEEIEEIQEQPLKVYTPEESELPQDSPKGLTVEDLLKKQSVEKTEDASAIGEEDELPEFENSFLAITNADEQPQADTDAQEKTEEPPLPSHPESIPLPEKRISGEPAEGQIADNPTEETVDDIPVFTPPTPPIVDSPAEAEKILAEPPVTFFDEPKADLEEEQPTVSETTPEGAQEITSEEEIVFSNGSHLAFPSFQEEEVLSPSEVENKVPIPSLQEKEEIENVSGGVSTEEVQATEEIPSPATETFIGAEASMGSEPVVAEPIIPTSDKGKEEIVEKPLIDEQLTEVTPTDFIEERELEKPTEPTYFSEPIPEATPKTGSAPEFIEFDDFDFDTEEEEFPAPQEESLAPEKPEEPEFPVFEDIEDAVKESPLPPVQEEGVMPPIQPEPKLASEPPFQEEVVPRQVIEETQPPVSETPTPIPTPPQPAVVQEKQEKKQEAFPMYQKYFPASYDGFIVFDFQSQKVIYTDAKIPEILKYEEQELVGKHIMELSPLFQEDGVLSSERMKQYFKKTLIVGQVAFEWKLQRKDQRSIWMRVSGIALPGEEINHLLFAFKDISGEKAKIFSSDETDWKLNMMVEKNYDGVIFLDSVSLRPASITQKATKLFNCTREEFYKHSPKRFMPHYQQDGRPSEEVFNQYLDVIKKKESVEFDWWLRKFDGAVFRARTVLYNLVQGNNKYIVMAIRELNPGSPNLSAESGSGQGYR
ncbi:MAG: PAS domain-containing protein [Bacteroidota bacterium]